MHYSFTQADSQRAFEEWGANCGPNALAFALGIHIFDAKNLIPDFLTKRYTSPAMMKLALAFAGAKFQEITFPRSHSSVSLAAMFSRQPALVRIQWEGPWLSGAYTRKWAYCHTHWVTTFQNEHSHDFVFDVNGGIKSFGEWDRDVVPKLTAEITKSNGLWHPTHIWRIVHQGTIA